MNILFGIALIAFGFGAVSFLVGALLLDFTAGKVLIIIGLGLMFLVAVGAFIGGGISIMRRC